MSCLKIAWQDVEPDVKGRNVQELTQQEHWSVALSLIREALDGRVVRFRRSALQAIMSHLRSDSNELGGLLLGRTFDIAFSGAARYSWLTFVDETLASKKYRNSPVSVYMEAEVWNGASERIAAGLMVVGWYHSHPNLGAFFSGTDRTTQAAFFHHPYALGLVIDPVREEHRFYFGPHSNELDAKAIVFT